MISIDHHSPTTSRHWATEQCMSAKLLRSTRPEYQLHHETQLGGAPPSRRARLAGHPVHDLRHSHATQLLAVGARPDVVSKRLGHSSVAFTLSTYAHVLEGDQRASVARLFAVTP